MQNQCNISRKQYGIDNDIDSILFFYINMCKKVYILIYIYSKKLVSQKIVAFTIVFVLVTQLALTSSIMGISYALNPIPGPRIFFSFSLGTAEGFETVDTFDNFGETPEFVLKRGSVGTVNVTFMSEDDQTVLISLWDYGGLPPYNHGWSGGKIPEGIIFNIEPSNITLLPNSRVTATLTIGASQDTEIRSYNLTLHHNWESETRSGRRGGSTVLTIIEDSILVTTTSTVTSYKTTSITSTVTETFIEKVAEPTLYVWAVGATVIAIILPVILILRKRR